MRQAFFVYGRDREDADIIGFNCAIPMPKPVETYQDAFDLLVPVLTSREFVERLIEEDCCEDDDFEGRPYKFQSVSLRNYQLEFDFVYCGDDPDYLEDIVTVGKSMNFIDLCDDPPKEEKDTPFVPSETQKRVLRAFRRHGTATKADIRRETRHYHAGLLSMINNGLIVEIKDGTYALTPKGGTYMPDVVEDKLPE